MSLYANIYDLVKKIPAGRVTNYGAIARVVGCGARQVGYAMAATPSGQDIPWHRVVNSKGEISARKQGNCDNKQHQLLLSEGVLFDKQGRINLAQFGWDETDFLVLEDLRLDNISS